MTKKFLLWSSILALTIAGHFFANGADVGKDKNKSKLIRRESAVREMPDSLFTSVEMEDLLDDEVYVELAKEGWSSKEIMQIMKHTIADKKKARYKDGYVHYAKEVVPMFRRMIGGDTLAQFLDTVYTEKMRRSVERAVSADLLNAYWPPLEYIPPRDRPGTDIRKPGYFREPKFKPSCGRICWMTLHPTDPNKLYVGPDGGGIFKTDDCGEHWECITDRIPNRSDRSCVNGYAIPVDPDDWDHVFGFMSNSSVWETCDGGQSWRKIQGATHKGFKRGDCFRDAEGKLKFIGCTTTNWYSTLWISEDTCKTWTAVQVPDSLKDIHPSGGYRGLWFQYIVTDPTDRNKIYLPTSRSILYFDDGAKSTMVNGKRVYNIKKMHFQVFDEAGNRRYANHASDRGADVNNDAIFPCPANVVGDLVINPNKPTQWWFATGSNCVGMGDCSAVYRSEDGGKTWITLQDLAFRIGSGCVFGNELANVWLGGFGVNFADTTKVYGCSMSSAKSWTGGRVFNQFSWANPLAAKHDDGRYIRVSASRHNADNHCIRSHASGRVFRGSDGGMLMIDPAINNGEWTQIGSDMGQMLFYHVVVNEFGDQVIAGNTQDIDGQTYRYGRWGHWRGYEGSEVFINPYTSAVYFSGVGSVGWDPAHMSLSSWFNAQTKADVVTGSWFLTRSGMTSGKSFMRCDDLGKTVVNLEPAIGEGINVFGRYGLCRDKGRCTVYVVTGSGKIKRSIDGGNTFENLYTSDGRLMQFSGSVIATDPNNSDVVYFAQQGKVNRISVPDGTWEQIGTGLPNIPCSHLMYHEGSGDLYFYHSGSAGIYILECLDRKAGTYVPEWRYWTKGYNSGKSTNVEINYTTQEMVICDFGRGAWVADLEHPADRYFDNGFALKEYSFKDGRRTIGIDTDWTIPLYYYFKWTVNDEEIDNPYQYLRRALEPGDRVKLELTLRESPDVKTTSAVFTVSEVATAPDNENNASQGDKSFDIEVVKEPGQALYSNGKGRVDLGYYDYFFNDFTVEFWLKPVSDGTVLANCTREGDPKGWHISVESGALKFEYSPRNVMPQPVYEAGITQTSTLRGGAVQYSNWNHVAVVHKRYAEGTTSPGTVALYLNGKKVAESARIIPEATLNNSMILSLFGDGIERRTIEASIDELKIWSMALTEEQLRKEMHSTNADNKDGLVAYWPFNGGTLESDLETFTRKAPKSRVLAETTHRMMSVPICARHVCYEMSTSGNYIFKSGDTDLLGFTDGTPVEEGAPVTDTGKYGVYVFDASQWQNEEDNLDTDYFDYHPMGYLIHGFDAVAKDELEFDFYPVEGEFNPDKAYRLYAADPNNDKQVWDILGTAEYNAEKGTIHISGVKLSQLVDKKLLLVTTKPSVELKIEGIGADGVLSIYDESNSTFPLSANILAGLPEPNDVYEIMSDGILKPSGLYFANGKATGELRLDLTKLGTLNSSVRTTLRSKDNAVVLDSATNRTRPSLIPLTIDVRNRIAPRQSGTGIKMLNGYVGVGSVSNYKALLNNNNMTVMGWIRIDSLKNFNNIVNLLTFRDNNGVTGLRLTSGALTFAHNGRDIWYDNAFKVTAANDLGRWHHYALVYGNNGIEFYLDGVPHRNSSYKTFTTSGVGGFYLGKDSPVGSNNNNDNFCGAYDQVAAWNRSLSHDEVIKYMYSGVPLNDKGLLTYMNMDYRDENDVPRDVYNCEEIKPVATTSLGGSVTFGEPTPIPFDAKAFYNNSDPQSPVTVQFPGNKGRSATITSFRGTPYCYLNHDFQSYSALNQEFYSITFKEKLTDAKRPADTDSVTLTYRHRTIIGDEHLAVALRRTGTLEHLAGFIPASTVEAGVATFRVPLSYLTEASEMMFFTYPLSPDDPEGERPALIQMSFAPSIISRITEAEDETPMLVLSDEQTSVPVIADVIGLSRNRNVPVRVIVNETTYATASQDTIDFSTSENQFVINLDMEKIDKFGINPITLNLEGANANELKLNVCLEPYVILTLENGDHRQVVSPGASKAKGKTKRKAGAESGTGSAATNTFRTNSPVANLEVSAELVQGYLPAGERVQLEVLTELSNSLSIGSGNLLQDEAVTFDELGHSSSEHVIHEGWNLIGNPYLSNINLTKEKNVDYDPEKVTKFFYQADPETGNYSVYDMTDYDAAQRIHPFQSYFVQVMSDDAAFTVTPVAKETEPTKRTRSYKVTEVNAVTFGIEDLENTRTYDRVTLNLDDEADENFALNEDAPKMWNVAESSPELYAMSADGKETAVATTSANTIDLGLKSPENTPLRLVVLNTAGMDGKYIIVHDNVMNRDWEPSDEEPYYEFNADKGTANNRFTITVEDDFTTGMKDVNSSYRVTVENSILTVDGLMGDAFVSVYTPGGLNILDRYTKAPTVSVYLEPGAYIVTINENNKKYTSKITVQ